jgi:hypothetical protein
MALMACSVAGGQTNRARVDFNRDVLPVLAENCFACHGSDINKRQAGLRLDTADGAYKQLASGKIAVVGGDLKASELSDRITRHDGSQMPPAYSNKKLTAAQISLLQRWILQGGKYAPHWSYAPVKRVAPPAVKADRTDPPAWDGPLGPIDWFILARLHKERLHPSPLADRAALIRRLSLDLTGLPPTPQEVNAFLRDKSPHAYAKVIDRLLASPHYGERMAVTWLDLVRYADTVGYHGDQDVCVWPYRDYVVNAFNRNKRFDDFTREQLAGDLLPHATPEQRVASGYNRLGMMSAEGGIQDKEYLAKYFADRVRNASAVWLGSTLGCAECHDHKYDPFTQKDFYRFGAFFADLKEKGFYDAGYSEGDWGPSLKLPDASQQAQLARFETDITAAKQALTAVSDDSLASGRTQWESAIRQQDAAKALAWKVATPTQATSSGGSTLTIRPDGIVMVTGTLPEFDTYTVTLPASQEKITAIRLEALPDESLPGNGYSRSGTYFVLSDFDVAVQHGNGPAQPVTLASVEVSGDDEGYPGLASIDGNPKTGWAIVNAHSDGKTAVFRFDQPLQGGPDVHLVVRIHHEMEPRLAIGKFRLALSSVEHPDLNAQGLPDDVLAALRKDPGQRTPAETQAITRTYREVAPGLETARRNLARLEADRSLLLGRIPQTLVSEAVPPRVIRLLPRGNWMDDSGEIVPSGVPHFLRQVGGTERATRLDMANWIVSPDNPLTARVFVNRLWKQFFGVGLDKNLDDFGIQGEVPVHPELLDWLASEFMQSGWDIKHIVRLMVTSDTYQQSSNLTPLLLERDPYNRLYARQTAFRLDAEFVRDVALKVSGLLSDRLGGPSVKPYQPRGYLAALNFPHREWSSDVGEDLYRRGLYTHWQRTFLHPSLLAFDAPTREEATCTRSLSNTPMQALVLMNDPIFVEAGRVFAARIMHQGGRTFQSRLTYAYQNALSRAPEPREIAILRHLYQIQHARYAADRQAATRLISSGEWPIAKDLDAVDLAAWTFVARAILNLHETITRS